MFGENCIPGCTQQLRLRRRRRSRSRPFGLTPRGISHSADWETAAGWLPLSPSTPFKNLSSSGRQYQERGGGPVSEKAPILLLGWNPLPGGGAQVPSDLRKKGTKGSPLATGPPWRSSPGRGMTLGLKKDPGPDGETGQDDENGRREDSQEGAGGRMGLELCW